MTHSPTDGLPHVTTIIKQAGLIDTTWMKDRDRDKGSAVHAATHYHDEGELNRETLHPEVELRLVQYERFRRESGAQILSIEERIQNLTYRYCGTLDRRVLINGHEGVLDLKGVTPQAWHALQVAAYAGCFPGHMKRWCLYLSDDRYKLIEHTDPDDWGTFVAALTLSNWKARKGLKE